MAEDKKNALKYMSYKVMQRGYKMNYKETGFRGLYKNFAAFRLNDVLKANIEGFPDADKGTAF